MRQRARKRRKRVGEAPGTLVYTGQHRDAAAGVRVFDFADTHCDEVAITRVEDIAAYKARPSVTWIDIDGVNDAALVERVGKLFNLHPLVLEDVLNVEQRPKLEDNSDYLYLVAKMLSYDEAAQELVIEQVSFVLGANYLITFQDKPGDVFEPVRTRLRQSRGRIRTLGADYLLYALLDAIVDNYVAIVDRLSERVADLEDHVVTRPQEKLLSDTYALRRDMIFLRKAVLPLREVVQGLHRSQSPLVAESTGIYLRDLLDHMAQVIDGIDTTREILSEMHDVYLSSVSNRTNQVMKVLALFSSIFMPLTFITGIFGMNFKYFPELEWKFGLVGVVITMVIVATVMLVFFRRKRWI